MNEFKEKLSSFVIKIITFLAIGILAFIIFFIIKESLPLFKKINIIKFVSGNAWNPTEDGLEFGILYMILGSLYTSILAVFIALPLGIGFAIYITCYLSDKSKELAKATVQMLMGIPSIIFGFIGLMILIKFFEKNFKMISGESVLAGAIVLAIMILPCIVSTTEETMSKVLKRYNLYSKVLGVSDAFMIKNLILSNSSKGILAGIILAFSRAMGETMAVMLVIGNSSIMPKLLGKAQTIPALIALEMGSAEIGSIHYHALFASGLVLMIILMFINVIIHIVKSKLK